MELIKASLMAAVGGGGGANVAPKPQTIQRNGTFYARDDDLDGYSEVTVRIDIPTIDETTFTSNGDYTHPGTGGWSPVHVDVKYHPKEDATLKEVSAVEDDTQVVEPEDGENEYYPYIYLGAVQWPIPSGADYENVGKRYNGVSQEYTVTPFIDIIDKSTGQSVQGYPKRIAPSSSWSIYQGGYMRIDGWEMASDTSVRVYLTRYNTTYTQGPISWDQSQNTETYLIDYVTGPFVIKDK